MQKLKILLPLILWMIALVPSQSDAKESDEEKIKPEAVGNFALPVSQQPGPLVSFGQNIIDQGRWQVFLFADAFLGNHTTFTQIIPSLLYGITDDFYLFVSVPFTPENKNWTSHSSGMEDLSVQLEYAFYTRNTPSSADQATLVANIAFPTGSSTKNPPTGFGSCSFFLGGTFNHMSVDWFIFTSPGALWTTAHHGTKFGDQFLYELGFGRNIPSPDGWIFAWMVEFDGLYACKNKIKGTLDPNSGGNVIYLTPSIWVSSETIILQFGVGYPIVQDLFGNQPKNSLSLAFDFGYTF